MTKSDLFLKTLTEKYPDGYINHPMEVLPSYFPAFSKKQIYSFIDDLEERGLISTSFADDELYELVIHQTALAYLINQNDREEKAKQEKKSDRIWSLKLVVLGYVLGFSSGAGLILFKNYLDR